NFAMTDYSSQGKTRIENLVDLHHCRSHFSVYTCLLRGSTSEGTVIVQGWDATLITRGISGYLHQEFREQELLNEITLLKYEAKSPADIKGDFHTTLIRSYQLSKGHNYDPKDLHLALIWHTGDPAKLPIELLQSSWTLVGGDRTAEKVSDKKATKYGKRRTTSDIQPPKTKRKKAVVSIPPPIATLWDPSNYSCSYDAIFSILYDVWQGHSAKWDEILKASGPYLGALSSGFVEFQRKSGMLEMARN
ncbi:hypothetical protein B0H10DRAFT_1746003, partial [Mycena sp. CBHHK59/15]